MGGQVGIVGHIEISDNVMIAGKSLVTKSIFKQDIISGIPAKNHKKRIKQEAIINRKPDIIKNDGTQTFLKKWGITPKFFFKYYLKTGKKFDGLLNDPNKNLFFYFELLVCKIKKSLS